MCPPGEGRLNVLRSRLASCEIERVVLRVEIKSASTPVNRKKEAFTQYTAVLMNIRMLNRAIIEVENRLPGTSGAGDA